MGMYTEIYVNADLEGMSEEVNNVLHAICNGGDEKYLEGYPGRWSMLGSSGSYYTPNTHCRYFKEEGSESCGALLLKGDIKNYGGEIEEFFKFIAPYCEGEFIGYKRYEEDELPTLMLKSEIV